jgi:hypothetical protein
VFVEVALSGEAAAAVAARLPEGIRTAGELAARLPEGVRTAGELAARMPESIRTAGELADPDSIVEGMLPLRAELAQLVPWGGLRRGSTVAVRGSTSLLLAVLADATADGTWAAVVGLPGLCALAAADFGVKLSRLALVPQPGAQAAEVVSALLDGISLVVVADGVLGQGQRGVTMARRLSGRARNRGAVLVPFGGSWPGADLEITCTRLHWLGLGQGHGYLSGAEAGVTVRGRGAASRPRSGTLLLPDESVAEVGSPVAVSAIRSRTAAHTKDLSAAGGTSPGSTKDSTVSLLTEERVTTRATRRA